VAFGGGLLATVAGMAKGEQIKPPWWLKPANKFFIIISRLGLNYGREGPVVLTVRGRESGQLRSTPVTPMTVDGMEYVVGGFPGADWVHNVRARGEVTLTRGHRHQQVRAVELSPDEARPLLRVWPSLVPTGVGFMKRAGLVTDGRPEEFEALAGRCAVFRFEPI
jgi:deazaflavin-dependent oxidoreductase (nitroreductase family)